MDKEQFLHLTRNYTSLTSEETQKLDQLQQQFPYSQVIHNLVTRGAQDNQFENSKHLLNISAVYSTDRGVLKDIISAPKSARNEALSTSVAETPVTDQVKPVAETQVWPEASGLKEAEAGFHPSPEVDSLTSDELNEAIMADLKRLQELKHDFEVSVEEFHKHETHVTKPAKEPKAKPIPPVIAKKKVEESALPPEPTGEGLLEEIKAKKKLVPENPKQKEQIDLIDQFIKKSPSIQKNTGNSEGGDLTEKNFSLTDNVVSETLVEILLRQGKKDKAIEVLKKLIWKFPQKKAIFAAQIDELKK